MKEYLNQLTEMLELMMEDEKFFPVCARMSRKFYEELVKAGFSEEESIQIVANFKGTK